MVLLFHLASPLICHIGQHAIQQTRIPVSSTFQHVQMINCGGNVVRRKYRACTTFGGCSTAGCFPDRAPTTPVETADPHANHNW